MYEECNERLAKLLDFEAEVQRGGSVVIMTGEGMVALWGGLKSVIPWPCQTQDVPTGCWLMGDGGSERYRVLCVGNGAYGCGMGEMVQSLRYPNIEVRLVESAWDQPIDVGKAVKEIEEWKPDLVTSKGEKKLYGCRIARLRRKLPSNELFFFVFVGSTL